MDKRRLVAVVDDSESVRESLPGLLQHVGFAVRTFASAEEFLSAETTDETSCLILDVGKQSRSFLSPRRVTRRSARASSPPAP